jgi:hypothetical protein
MPVAYLSARPERNAVAGIGIRVQWSSTGEKAQHDAVKSLRILHVGHVSHAAHRDLLTVRDVVLQQSCDRQEIGQMALSDDDERGDADFVELARRGRVRRTS